MGMDLRQAGREAMKDLRRLTVPFPPGMNLVAVDRKGNHTAMTTETEREVTYIHQSGDMAEPVIKKRIVIPLTKKQKG
jgi:beta-aspartyl-peptidase (threonine type)